MLCKCSIHGTFPPTAGTGRDRVTRGGLVQLLRGARVGRAAAPRRTSCRCMWLGGRQPGHYSVKACWRLSR